jgi:hypothetical protein
LSLVDAVAKLHGAELTLADHRPGLKVSLAFRAFGEERAPKAAARSTLDQLLRDVEESRDCAQLAPLAKADQ